MNTPLVTVNLPVYNVARYLEECFDSLLAALHFSDFHILCCDDCSTDKSAAILARYAQHSPCITALHNRSSKGNAYTRNQLIAHTTTPYLALCDADDIIHPERFIYQCQFLEAHKDIDIVGTAMEYFNEDNRQQK